MSTKQMFSFNNLTQDVVSKPKWTHLADLSEQTPQRILTIRPRRRTYLHQSEAGYDWAAGREFVVIAESSPYYGQVVAVDERRNLIGYGYTHVQIHYNTVSVPLTLALN